MLYCLMRGGIIQAYWLEHWALGSLLPSTHLQFSYLQSSHLQFTHLQFTHLKLPGFPADFWLQINGFQCFSDDPKGFIKNESNTLA